MLEFGDAAGKLALLTCLASTLCMTGLIWFVQVVHYPLFARVDPASFARYHEAHTRTTGRVVLAPMVLELGTSLLLVSRRPAGTGPELAWAGLAAAGACWLSTVLIQVPLHRRLAAGFDPGVHSALVATNGLRTACWTAHAGVVLAMVARSIP